MDRFYYSIIWNFEFDQNSPLSKLYRHLHITICESTLIMSDINGIVIDIDIHIYIHSIPVPPHAHIWDINLLNNRHTYMIIYLRVSELCTIDEGVLFNTIGNGA